MGGTGSATGSADLIAGLLGTGSSSGSASGSADLLGGLFGTGSAGAGSSGTGSAALGTGSAALLGTGSAALLGSGSAATGSAATGSAGLLGSGSAALGGLGTGSGGSGSAALGTGSAGLLGSGSASGSADLLGSGSAATGSGLSGSAGGNFVDLLTGSAGGGMSHGTGSASGVGGLGLLALLAGTGSAGLHSGSAAGLPLLSVAAHSPVGTAGTSDASIEAGPGAPAQLAPVQSLLVGAGHTTTWQADGWTNADSGTSGVFADVLPTAAGAATTDGSISDDMVVGSIAGLALAALCSAAALARLRRWGYVN